MTDRQDGPGQYQTFGQPVALPVATPLYTAPVYAAYQPPVYDTPIYAVPVAPQPLLAGTPCDARSDCERFNYGHTRCKDSGFLIAFVLHLLAVLVLLLAEGGSAIEALSAPDHLHPAWFHVKQVMASLVPAGIVSLVFAGFWLMVLRRCLTVIVYTCAVFLFLLMALLCITCFALGEPNAAFAFMTLCFVMVCYGFAVKSRIGFTKAVIKVSLKSLGAHPGPVVVGYCMAVVKVLWLAIWSFAFLCATHVNNRDGVSQGWLIYLFLIVSLYWTAQVLSNIGQVTTAGTVATWWLVPDSHHTTCGSLRRACTTSLGSICFGSLIVAFTQSIRAMLSLCRPRQPAHSVDCSCCCGPLEGLCRFVNKYAYAQVAIYGKGFIEAAKDTWEVFVRHNFELLITDDLTGFALAFGDFLGALLGCFVGGIIAYQLTTDPTNYTYIWLGLLSFVVGWLMTSVVTSVISGAVSTTYVVWAQCTQEIAQIRPEEYQALKAAAKCQHPEHDY